MSSKPFWRTKSLQEMTTAEWESLCDGCARCCLEKQIGAVLASLARLGHITTKDGKHFEIRRIA